MRGGEIRMAKPEIRMKPETAMTSDEPVFDLEERTARFGEGIIAYARTLPVDEVTRPVVSQLVRAGTSVGANYCEADDADSRKDFKFKIGLCRREAKEAAYWLRMSVAAQPVAREKAKVLWKEAKELNLIFGAIRRKCS
jgi:four helix bundle protein